MALGQKYEVGIYDRDNIAWIVKFFKQGWTGDVSILKGGDVPISFELLNEADLVTDPIKASQVICSIQVDENFILDDIFSVDDMSTYVEIFQDEDSSAATPYWVGYVDPNQYQEPYDVAPYYITVVCIDGLTLLTNILYAQEDSELRIEYFNGRKYTSQVILDVLGLIGYSEFKEYINKYEDNMLTTVDDSPFDQSKIDVDLYKNRYCNEVLSIILGGFNACIRQKDGTFQIYRPVDNILPIVYGRYFTAYSTKSSISFDPNQYINRASLKSSIFRQVPGGTRIGQKAFRKIIFNQNYGYKDSWIDNWQLKGISLNPTTAEYDGWASNGITLKPIGYWIPGENEGLVVGHASNTDPIALNHYAGQTFGLTALLTGTGRVFVFSFDYMFYNYSAGVTIDNAFLYLEIRTASSSYYLKEGTTNVEAVWDASAAYITIEETSVPSGNTGWKSYSRLIYGLPDAGPFIVRFHRAKTNIHTQAVAAIKNIKFCETSDSLSIKRTPKPTWFERFWYGKLAATRREEELHPTTVDYQDIEEIVTKQIIILNNVNGEQKTFNFQLGDVLDTDIQNVLDQFMGVFSVLIRGTKALAASQFDTDHDGDYTEQDITTSGVDIIFTGNNETDFTGASTIVNTSGDLSGTVVTTTPFSAATNQIDRIYFSSEGSSGEGFISIDFDSVGTITFSSTIEQAIIDFVNTYGGSIPGYTVTRIGTAVLQFEKTDGTSFTTAYTETTPDLAGIPYTYQVGAVAVNRVDTITLTGTYGTANITVDGVTEEVSITEIEYPSQSWGTREQDSSGSQNSLFEMMAAEIAHQHSRSKDLFDAVIQELPAGVSQLNTLGNFRDDYLVDDSDFPVRELSLWTLISCTLALSGRYARFTSALESSADTYCSMRITAGVSLNGLISNTINIKYKVISGTPGYGKVYYQTAGHGRSESYYKLFALNQEIQTQIDKILVTGNNGACEFGTELGVKEMTFTSDIETSVDNYITDFAADLLSINGILATKEVVGADVYLVYTAAIKGFTFTTVKNNVSGTLNGTISNYQYNTQLATNTWHILKLDMSDLYAGGTDWVSNTITQVWFEFTDNDGVIVDFDWIGFSRFFVINRGTFDVRNKKWKLDLMEIIR